MKKQTRHVVLLGDSVLDNGAYVPGQPAVSAQLRDRLGEPVTLLAVDAPGAAMQTAAEFGLCAFNDVITRAAARTGTDVIDNRVIFDSDDDYANPIEPSTVGGSKLVRVIDDWLCNPQKAQLRT